MNVPSDVFSELFKCIDLLERFVSLFRAGVRTVPVDPAVVVDEVVEFLLALLLAGVVHFLGVDLRHDAHRDRCGFDLHIR